MTAAAGHHEYSWLDAVTDFGDSAVLWPLAIVLLLWLLAMRPAGAALAWLLALATLNGLLGVMKLYFFACPAGVSLHSPSGHSGFGLLMYGALAAVLAVETERRWLRLVIIAVGGGLVAAIALSRVLLGMHSVVEVGLGALVGFMALALFVHAYRRNRGRRRGQVMLWVLVPLVAVTFHGDQLHIEPWLHGLSASLGVRSVACER